MRITLQFHSVLRGIIGEREDTIDLSNDVTIEEALTTILNTYAHHFRDYIHDEQGSIQLVFGSAILINGRSITTLQGLQTKLEEGDVISIIPPGGGG